MTAAPSIDDLARALGRAQALAEARPDDRERERRFLEARCAYLDAVSRQLTRERDAALARASEERAARERLARTIPERIAALMPKIAERTRRRPGRADSGAPLFERGAG